MCVGVFIYVYLYIHVHSMYIHFSFFIFKWSSGTIIHCGERSPGHLRDYQICFKKKMVFMFSYPKSTEEVMVVRNKWNFDHNL